MSAHSLAGRPVFLDARSARLGLRRLPIALPAPTGWNGGLDRDPIADIQDALRRPEAWQPAFSPFYLETRMEPFMRERGAPSEYA